MDGEGDCNVSLSVLRRLRVTPALFYDCYTSETTSGGGLGILPVY